MNASDCHFWTLLIREAESGQQSACCPLQFFFFPPRMLEAVIATSHVMERPAALMDGRKEAGP